MTRLVRSFTSGGRRVHLATCRHVRNPLPWHWAEGRDDDEWLSLGWFLPCKVCLPEQAARLAAASPAHPQHTHREGARMSEYYEMFVSRETRKRIQGAARAMNCSETAVVETAVTELYDRLVATADPGPEDAEA